MARVITKQNINDFNSIRDKTNINKLYTDTGKTTLLDNKFIDDYNNFSFTRIIADTVKTVQTRADKELDKYNSLPHNKNIINKNLDKDSLNKIKHKVEFANFVFSPNDKFELNHKPKVIIKATLKHTIDLPEHIFLSKILNINNKFLELSDKDKIKFIQENFKYSFNDYGVASIDPGVVNHASMTFNNVNSIKVNKRFNSLYKNKDIEQDLANNFANQPKSINLNNLLKGLLFSGDKYNNYVRNKELELDKIKSKLIPESIKLIQSKIDKFKVELERQKLSIMQNLIHDYNAKHKNDKDFAFLSLEEVLDNEINMEIFEKDFDIKAKLLPKIEINKTDSDMVKFAKIGIYKNPEYLLKLQKLNNYKANYLHKMSSCIIDICNYNNINILIFGKNDGWKNKSNIGKLNNRNQGSFAHTKLIDLLKYKALMFGITVLITEESNTSKTSFVNNSELKVYKQYGKSNTTPVQNGFKYKVKKEIIKHKELNNVEKTFDSSIKNINININTHKNIKQKPYPALMGIGSLASESIQETIDNTCNDKGIAKHSFGGVRQTRGIFINDDMRDKNIHIADNKNNGKNIGLKTKKAKSKKLVVQADINASFNIMRKDFVCPTK